MGTIIVPSDTHYTFRGQVTMEGNTSLPASTVSNASVTANADIESSKMAQRVLSKFVIPFTSWRVHDNMLSFLPSAGAADDLGYVGGTFGSASGMLKTSDAKTTTITQYARAIWPLPLEYDSGETIQIRANAGMETTISDGTATIDFSIYEVDREGGVGSDLVSTAATDINSLTLGNKDFTVNGAGLIAGDELDIRVAVAITDTATGTAVTGVIGSIEVLCDTRG